MDNAAERIARLRSTVIKDINKKVDNISAMSMADEKDGRSKITAISTTCLSIDNIFGCGGIPRGRIIDIYGSPSSGKTTLALYIVGQIQKNGGVAAWFDAEYSFVSDYARKLGVDTENLILSQPYSGEDAFNAMHRLIESGDVDIIVVDSTASLVPAKELKMDIEEHTIALQARMMSIGLRKITGISSTTKTTIVFISQMRDKIGSFVGPTKDSTGGNALKFYSSVRLKVDRIKTLKGKDDVVFGNRLKIEATKNKVGLPFRKAEVDLYFERGIDVIGDILDVATTKGIVIKAGISYMFEEVKLGVGREQARDFLEKNIDIYDKIKKYLVALSKGEDKVEEEKRKPSKKKV